MLPKQHRLVKAEEFSNALRRGTRVGSKYLVLSLWVPPDQKQDASLSRSGDPKNFQNTSALDQPVRVGFIVAKRQLPRAVDRNRIKRRLRHLIAAHLNEVPAGCVVVVRVLSSSKDADTKQLETDLENLLNRAKKKLSKVTQ